AVCLDTDRSWKRVCILPSSSFFSKLQTSEALAKLQLHAGLTIPFSRLDSLPLVLPSRPSPWRHVLDEVSRRKGISLNVVLEADSVTIQKEVAASAKAYTILGPYAMMEDVRAGRLRASRIVNPDLKRFVTWAMPK